MKHPELSALILRNLKDFDAAARLFETEIEPTIDKCISTIVENWAIANDWKFHIFKGSNDYDISLPDWRMSELEWKAHINLLKEENSSDSIGGESYWISNLCGLNGCCGFTFHINAPKAKIRQTSQLFMGKMLSKGFLFSERKKLFYIPLTIEAKQLAKAIEEDRLEETLKLPIFEVLDKVDRAKDLLRQFVKDVMSQDEQIA